MVNRIEEHFEPDGHEGEDFGFERHEDGSGYNAWFRKTLVGQVAKVAYTELAVGLNAPHANQRKYIIGTSRYLFEIIEEHTGQKLPPQFWDDVNARLG